MMENKMVYIQEKKSVEIKRTIPSGTCATLK